MLPPAMPPGAGTVQLGILRLKFVLATGAFSGWVDLRAALSTSTATEGQDEAVYALNVLGGLLRDNGVGLEGACAMERTYGDDRIVVRVWMMPSDAPRSAWKRTGNKGRYKLLRSLFELLEASWEVHEEGLGLMDVKSEDDVRMADLYASIPSPSDPSFTQNYDVNDEAMNRLVSFEEPCGVKTTMYPYQFRSVSRMLQMENNPKRMVDPIFVPLQEAGREGTYYVNFDNMDVQRQPSWYDLPRGGILCEQMGVGKTLMCLALICATLNQPCMPDPANINISKITTEYRETFYPFSSDDELRQTTGVRPKTARFKKPSLAELCADILCITYPKASEDELVSEDCKALFVHRQPTYYYDIPPLDDCSRAAKIKTLKREITKIYLASTTLIVVPSILVPQWQHEVEKHLVKSTLKLLVVTGEMPDVSRLMRHDVVLMSVERFSQEYPPILQAKPKSPLLQARWKRLILDEGHVAGVKSSNAMRLAVKLSVERRWAVSGTPTRHLQQGGEMELDLPSDSGKVATGQVWTKRDLDDVSRIGTMMGGFLAMQPYKSDAAFQERVTAPLRGRRSFGAVRRIRDLMGALMVKHQPHVIDVESALPPSTRTVTLVRFHPMQRLTYNALAALVVSNVHTSAFTDRDYLLHPSQAGSFKQVVANLHLACFWYSAPEFGVEECIVRSEEILGQTSLAPKSHAALEEAVEHMRRAIDTPGWSEWMRNSVSLPFEAQALPRRVREAWSDSEDVDSGIIDTRSLLDLCELNRPDMSEHDLHIRGWDYRAYKCEAFFKEMRATYERFLREGKKKEKERYQDLVDALPDTMSAADVRKLIGPPPWMPKAKPGAGAGAGGAKGGMGGATGNGTAAARPTAPPRGKGNGAAKVAKHRSELEASLSTAAENAKRTARHRLLPVRGRDKMLPRPLPSVLETTSRSAKVNHVLQSVLDSDPADKFVIFGERIELGHLTEALDLVEIKSAYAGQDIEKHARIAALRAFDVDAEVRVCMLELRLAARGLNLVVANRMIFLSPVWSLDVQAQAIKRVHRIGQTRETKIEILVTEGTFEEDIANRAVTARTEAEEQMYTRDMIENPRFVYVESMPTRTFTIPFIPLLEREPTTPPMVDDAESPVSDVLVTPAGGADGERQRGEVWYMGSGSPSGLASAGEGSRSTGPGRKRASAVAVDGQSGKAKKRARVAFA